MLHVYSICVFFSTNTRKMYGTQSARLPQIQFQIISLVVLNLPLILKTHKENLKVLRSIYKCTWKIEQKYRRKTK